VSGYDKASKTWSIEVKWQEVTGAAGYKIYRKKDSGDWSLVKTAGNTVTSWTDTGRKPDSYYYYKMAGYAQSGGQTVDSAASPTVKVKTSEKPTAGKRYVKASDLTKSYEYKFDNPNKRRN
jgi:fibronectin type 3 domain-containing protein